MEYFSFDLSYQNYVELENTLYVSFLALCKVVWVADQLRIIFSDLQQQEIVFCMEQYGTMKDTCKDMPVKINNLLLVHYILFLLSIQIQIKS